MKRKKNIAILCDYRLIPERVGGMDRFFWLFDAKCKKRGYSIVWFFPNQEDHGSYHELNIIPANGKSIEETFLEHNQSFDVVITHFLELNTPFYKQVKKKEQVKKMIVVDHNPRPFEGYSLKKRIQKKLKGWLFSASIDLFVGVSQYTVKEILKDFGEGLKSKTQVIYNGIDFRKFKQRESRAIKQPRFLVACHLRYSKGIQDLIEAVALLPNKVLNQIKIDVYGDGPYEKELKDLMKSKGVEKNFILKGSVANLYEIYCQYDYLLQPTHMECFSLAILESLSANVPVITTPVGGNKEVIMHGINGYILPVENPKEWSELIEKLYNGIEFIEENTSELVLSRFTIEEMVVNYIKLI